MSLVTVATDPSDPSRVVSGVIALPRIGVWHADLLADSTDQFEVGAAASISMDDGAEVLQGVVARAMLYEGLQQVRIVGGAGGMQKAATPKFYSSGATTADVVASLASDAGETVSGDSDAGTSIPGWTTIGVSVGRQLAELVRPLGAAWRIGADGTLWVGVETWPTSDVPDEEWVTLQYDHWNGILHLGMLAPSLLPGTVLGQEKIDRVEHRIESDSVRTSAWVLRDGAGGVVDQDFQAVARAPLRPFDFYALYTGTMKAQTGQKFDVQPDDPRIPTLSGIPIRNGVPGMTMRVVPGTGLMVGWSGGDPRQPYCAFWGGGESVNALSLGDSDLDTKDPIGSCLVLGFCIDPFSGATHFALGGGSKTVFAKR